MRAARATAGFHAGGFWRKSKTVAVSKLKSAALYSVFGGTVTVAGVSSANKLVGGSSVTGISGVQIGSGQNFANAASIQCEADIVDAYNYYTALPHAGRIYLGAVAVGTAPNFAGDIAGQRFAPNPGSKQAVFFAGAAITNSINVTFDSLGDPDVEFVMIVGAAAAFAAASTVTFAGGCTADKLTWVVTGAPSLGAMAAMAGNVLSPAGVGMGAGATLLGRALTWGTGAITMSANTVTTV
jgi:Ice-binding-like